jgi:glutathione S-transferase
MAGGEFTFADISVGYAIGIGHMLGLNDKMSPAVEDYYRRVTARPAYLKAMAG